MSSILLTALEEQRVFTCCRSWTRAEHRDSRIGGRADLHAGKRLRVVKGKACPISKRRSGPGQSQSYARGAICKLYLHGMLRSRTLMTNMAEAFGVPVYRLQAKHTLSPTSFGQPIVHKMQLDCPQRKQNSQSNNFFLHQAGESSSQPASDMSTTRRPYFVIAALPADDMAQQDLEIEQVFHIKAEEARDEIEKMKKSLNDNGFDFDCTFPQNALP